MKSNGTNNNLNDAPFVIEEPFVSNPVFIETYFLRGLPLITYVQRGRGRGRGRGASLLYTSIAHYMQQNKRGGGGGRDSR